LYERGYVEGEHFTIESRYAEGNPDLLPRLAAEVVGLQVEVIVTLGAQAIQAVRQATSTIPVVMVATGAPVEAGFVTSRARPGGNLTGLSLVSIELSGKRLELLKETVPGLSHVAVLANPANPLTAAQLRETHRAAQALQVQLHVVEVRGSHDLDNAFSALRSLRADAFIVLVDPMFFSQRARLAELTATSQLPAIYGLREDAEAGALMA
jgi:putative ABC transport system substrate-binding protein